jgi:diadenylate cyclase
MFASILHSLQHATLPDLADILLVTIIIYNLALLIRDTRAYQMAIGLFIIGLLFFVTQRAQLTVTYWLIRNFIPYIIIAIIVLFQDEIRSFLAGLGSRWLRRPMAFTALRQKLGEVFQAVDYLSQKKIGALIAVEKEVSLNGFLETGTRIDANLTKELLVSLFFPHSPLHDGAVIIQSNKVTAAACLLPLPSVKTLGEAFKTRTRHLAALGLSQETDAAVIVVSEESGEVSLAARGKLHKIPNKEDLEARLIHYLQR